MEIVERFLERGSGGELEALSSREAGGNALGRGGQTAQHGSHAAAILGRLVGAEPARLSLDEW